MRNLELGLKQNKFLRHFPMHQGIEEDYLHLEMTSEIKANKSEIYIEEMGFLVSNVQFLLTVCIHRGNQFTVMRLI